MVIIYKLSDDRKIHPVTKVYKTMVAFRWHSFYRGDYVKNTTITFLYGYLLLYFTLFWLESTTDLE